MDPVLEALLPLAHVDDDQRGREERVRLARRKLDAAAKAVATSHAERETLTARLAEVRKRIASLEADMRTYEQQRDRAQKALDQGMGSVDAAERQIATCRDRIDEIETRILEGFDERESLDEALAGANGQVHEAEQHRAGTKAEFEPMIAEQERAIAALEAKREALMADVPASERRVYTEMRARKGYALAEVDDGSCLACRTMVPYQLRTDLKEGRTVRCSSCGRWMYIRSVAEPVWEAAGLA